MASQRISTPTFWVTSVSQRLHPPQDNFFESEEKNVLEPKVVFCCSSAPRTPLTAGVTDGRTQDTRPNILFASVLTCHRHRSCSCSCVTYFRDSTVWKLKIKKSLQILRSHEERPSTLRIVQFYPESNKLWPSFLPFYSISQTWILTSQFVICSARFRCWRYWRSIHTIATLHLILKISICSKYLRITWHPNLRGHQVTTLDYGRFEWSWFSQFLTKRLYINHHV